MYEVRVIGAIKGMENDMEPEIQRAVEVAQTVAFDTFGLFEIFVIECEERMVGDKIGG